MSCFGSLETETTFHFFYLAETTSFTLMNELSNVRNTITSLKQSDYNRPFSR